MKRLTCLLLAVSLYLTFTGLCFGAHGISIDGKLKYQAGFEQFDYTSTGAEKGGNLVLHSIGSFDKLNPFTLKGVSPFGLETLVFDPLGVASLDEPFSEYGLIVKNIETADDNLSVVYTLNENATFSDGTPVTVEDIAYSLETLKGPTVHPFYPYYYKDISHAEILDDHRIRFVFSQANRELAMIATQIPVFSKRTFAEDNGQRDKSSNLVIPIGSGPYVVSKLVQGKSITYKRNPAYWAKGHPVRKGQFNYDTVTVLFYKDPVVSLEAFKAGEFDVLSVNSAKQWARDLDGPKFVTGELVKKIFPHSNNAGMQGFVMNTRKEVFKERPIRQAVGLAFNFEWTNNALFFGQYVRAESYFSNSYLAAEGLPQGLELEYLKPYKNQLPQEVFTKPLQAPVAENPNQLRQNLRKAKNILITGGYKYENGQLIDPGGEKVEFEILLVSRSFERVMASFVKNLEKLGMSVSYRTIDPTLYIERLRVFDFDMIVNTFGQSQSPGNEQRNYWHSEAADRPGSDNFAGIKSPVVDALVEKIIYAENSKSLTAACKALDRVLWYGYYVVPNWYMSGHRIAYYNKFSQPETLPLYYSPTQLIMTWWQ